MPLSLTVAYGDGAGVPELSIRLDVDTELLDPVETGGNIPLSLTVAYGDGAGVPIGMDKGEGLSTRLWTGAEGFLTGADTGFLTGDATGFWTGAVGTAWPEPQTSKCVMAPVEGK